MSFHFCHTARLIYSAKKDCIDHNLWQILLSFPKGASAKATRSQGSLSEEKKEAWERVCYHNTSMRDLKVLYKPNRGWKLNNAALIIHYSWFFFIFQSFIILFEILCVIHSSLLLGRKQDLSLLDSISGLIYLI